MLLRESILMHLDHKSLLSCRLVSTDFKMILDRPMFWIKIFKKVYGLKKLGQELAIIARLIGHFKYEGHEGLPNKVTVYILRNILEYIENISLTSLMKSFNKALKKECKIFLENLEKCFSRSLMKFHKILNQENKNLFQYMTIGHFATSFGTMNLTLLLQGDPNQNFLIQMAITL